MTFVISKNQKEIIKSNEVAQNKMTQTTTSDIKAQPQKSRIE